MISFTGLKFRNRTLSVTLAVLLGFAAGGSAFGETVRESRVFVRNVKPRALPVKGARLPSSGEVLPKGDAGDTFRHEIWGQTDFGEGYIYGPTNRRSGMTVVDIDRDGDNDFVFPGTGTNPQVMLNLGSNTAFYPGGSRTLDVSALPDGMAYDLGLEFGDLNGDGLLDLVAVTREESPLIKRLVWFKNEGTSAGAALPRFTYQGILYNSQRAGSWAGIWLSLGDIDNDGDQDLYVAEDFVDAAPPYHRIFFVENQGTPQSAQWVAPEQDSVLSNQMPDRFGLGKANALYTGVRTADPLQQEVSYRNKGINFSYSLGDIHLADWNLDGLTDFMFYDASKGMMWIPNLGTPTAPAWSPVLGNDGVPRYDHRATDGLDYIEGTFNIASNPESSKPGVEWLRDVFLSVNNRLKTYRFFVAEETYRIVQESPVAYPSGQGPAAFWDGDGDGDLDMFRMGISSGAATNLLMLRNEGTVYNPAWGDFSSLDSIPLNEGNADNSWRGDLYLFDDWNNSGSGPDFIVQNQDATLTRYRATPATTRAGVPTFINEEDNFGDIVNPQHTALGPQPRGFAMADFDRFEDGWSEILAVYSYTGGANLVLVDLLLGEIYDLPDFLDAPAGGTLNPDLIEGVAFAYVNSDDRPDVVVTLSDNSNYRLCRHWVYENRETDEFPFFELVPTIELTTPQETDDDYARTPSFVDLDADGDDDLFVAHRYPPTDPTNLRQYLRYYRNTGDTGLFYVRFRSVAGQQQALTLQLTTGGGSTNQLVTPQYDVLLNNSGGALFPNARWLAGPNAPTVDILDTTDLQQGYGFPGEVRALVDVLPPVTAGESKAIIVVGDTADGDLYPTFATLASISYFVLLSEGLGKDSIRFYADTSIDGDRDGQNDVLGKPTLAAVEDSVRNWARGADRVLVYLIDHGQRERFRLNATQFIESSALDSWIDALQSASPNTHVTTLIDTCESGSFMDNLKGQRRVNMTSAGVGPIEGVALFDKNEGISFSLQFWIQLFNGRTYGQAFKEAKASMEAINPLQRPQIDDDGDGNANEGNDGLIADGIRPGANFKVRGPSVFIGEVAPNQTLTSNSATLWLADVVTPFPVEGAKAIIVPPNFERLSADNNDEQPVSNLPSVLFSFNAALNRWEGNFNGFNQGGLYQVQYFVKTGGQYYASPRIGFVDRLNIPDAWEPDNTPNLAPWLTVNQVQGHNFHQSGDQDWVRFTSPIGSATFAVLAPRPRCQAIVELYREADFLNGNQTPLRTLSATEPGEEVVFDQTFSASEQYLLRVRNAEANVFGRDTSYLLLGAVGTGGLLSTALFITAIDAETNAPLAGATVQFNGSSVGTTSSEGITQVIVPDYGSYSISLRKDGYDNKTEQIAVNNSIEQALIRLTKTGTEPPPPPPPAKGCAGCASQPGTPSAWLGDGVVALLLLTFLAAASRKTERDRVKE